MKTLGFTLALISIIFLTSFHHLKAQEAKKTIGIEVETDPFAYLLRGYSLHVAHTYGHFRTSIGIFGIKQPDFLLSNDAFTVFSSGYDFKTDYLFCKIKGPFVGAQVTYGKDKMGLKNEAEREDYWGLSFGVRTGYRFMFGKEERQFKGFYLVPWVAMMYAPNAGTIEMGNERFKQSPWIPFPTLHVGYRF